MDIFPALDIMGGKVVRLTRGERSGATIYGDPIKIASKFTEYFRKLHVVDLDGAFSGAPVNLPVVRKIADETGAWIQLGGGFRTIDLIRKGNEAGAGSIIVGTAARDSNMLKEAAAENITLTVSLDVRNEKIATEGWIENTGTGVQELYKDASNSVNRFIYTDIERDGTLSGVNFIEKFWTNVEMIYAGGISSVDDILKLRTSGFTGAVVGKAIYENNIQIEDLAGVV